MSLFEKKIKMSPAQIQAVFTEWERRYRNDPGSFNSEAHKLLKETPDSYGRDAASMFLNLLEELG